MSMFIEAPYPGVQTGMILPNPQLDNTEGRSISLTFNQAIDGTRYTYVKTSSRKKLVFTWTNLGRGKLVEVQEFYKLYAGSHIRLTDFRGDVWDVIFEAEPTIAIEQLSLEGGGTRKESGSVTLEFDGVQIA
jgi:hypothetical protein